MFYIPCQWIIILDISKELVNWVIKSNFLFLFNTAASLKMWAKKTLCAKGLIVEGTYVTKILKCDVFCASKEA